MSNQFQPSKTALLQPSCHIRELSAGPRSRWLLPLTLAPGLVLQARYPNRWPVVTQWPGKSGIAKTGQCPTVTKPPHWYTLKSHSSNDIWEKAKPKPNGKFFWLEEAEQCQADLQLLRTQVQNPTVLKATARERVDDIKRKVASLEAQLKQAMELNRHYLTNQMKLINVLKQKNLEHYSYKLQIKKEKRHIALLVLEIESLRHRVGTSYMRRLQLVLSAIPQLMRKQFVRVCRELVVYQSMKPTQSHVGLSELLLRPLLNLSHFICRCVQAFHTIQVYPLSPYSYQIRKNRFL